MPFKEEEIRRGSNYGEKIYKHDIRTNDGSGGDGYSVFDFDGCHFTVSLYDKNGCKRLVRYLFDTFDEGKENYIKIKESFQHAIDNDYINVE